MEYANKNGAVLLYDAAYEAFITEDGLPRSIFEIEGAKTCAIEFCSLSKLASFTGTRCGYTIVPKALTFLVDGKDVVLNKFWVRRQTTKFNGVPYIIQRGAQAVFSDEGLAQIPGKYRILSGKCAYHCRHARRAWHPVLRRC